MQITHVQRTYSLYLNLLGKRLFISKEKRLYSFRINILALDCFVVSLLAMTESTIFKQENLKLIQNSS
ncbi:MAG: hypothetical protein A3G78_02110 [Alphaproteobacteria bacterium RIFCSPLOWO2_12_FULL_42_29]|nr:MAG: hypothetical protein A2Z80_03510 [Alphaproteobacteria bacterium GWA2_41_27]OFX08291.1 MAG: hypothetical protein A3G78_02110 [Alphaproteobacteria bacterium RIFCSPLOWO2_12_FULL_42_29]